jgi:hypothetical protein
VADNVTANPGAGGDTFASDDIGGVQFPRTKFTLGADGVNEGDVASGNPMPAKVADGNDVALGATTDAAVSSDATGTISGKIRGLVKILASVWDSINGRLKVDGSGVTQPVSGTFFQATQPVSATALPLPTGAATEATLLLGATAAKQDTGNTSLSSIDGKLSGALSVTGSTVGVTGNVEVVNDAGNPLPVSGNVAVTGSVTANAGTNLNTSALALDATLTGGTEKTQIYDPNFAQSAIVDQLRGLKVSDFVRVFGDSFADGIGNGQDAGSFPRFVATSGMGSGGVSGGQLTLRTGDAAVGSAATLQSVNYLAFVTGAVSGCQSGIKFPTTPTTWKIVSRKDGADTAVTSGSFSGTANTPDGNFHRYEIFFQGAGSAKFMVDSVLLHSLSGQPSAVRTSTLDFYIRYEITNDAVNTVARYGTFDTQNGYFFEAVYPVADLSMNVRGSTAFRMGPGVDGTGYPTALQANAVQEAGGNLEKILALLVEEGNLLRDLRTELRILNSNLTSGLNVQDDSDRMRGDPYFNQ